MNRNLINKSKLVLIMTISLLFVISSYFSVLFRTNTEIASISSIFVVLMAFPAYYGLIKEFGLNKGLQGIIILGIFAMVIESIGLITGFPYGQFSYNENLGLKILDIIPWTIFFAWTPLVLGSYTLAFRWFSDTKTRIIFSVLFLLVTDLILDPGAVFVGFWIWDNPGIYYGVPIINFIGWIFSGLIGVLLLLLILRTKIHSEYSITTFSSHYLSIIFWTSLALFAGMIIPFIIGMIFVITLVYKERKIFLTFSRVSTIN